MSGQTTAKKIVIVEDTKNIQAIVAFTLKNRGYNVFVSGDGADGMAKIKMVMPDLVILDAMLPNMTGFEICAEMKNDPKYKTIPVMIVSAITQGLDQNDEYWKKKSGADYFVSKPFKIQDLIKRIESHIGPGPLAPAAGK